MRGVKHVGGRDWGKWWTRHGPELPAALHAGIEREMTRLVLVKAQIKTLEAQQCTEVATGLQPQVAQLIRTRSGRRERHPARPGVLRSERGDGANSLNARSAA